MATQGYCVGGRAIVVAEEGTKGVINSGRNGFDTTTSNIAFFGLFKPMFLPQVFFVQRKVVCRWNPSFVLLVGAPEARFLPRAARATVVRVLFTDEGVVSSVLSHDDR